jgi:transketolase
MHFGVREFGMSAILNGISGHGGFIPYGGTFLTFSDYARNAVRMAALMHLRRRCSSIRTTRSASARTARRTSPSSTSRACASFRTWTCGGPAMPSRRRRVAGASAIENRDGPTCLILTRQAVPHQARSAAQVAAIKRGGYVLIDCDGCRRRSSSRPAPKSESPRTRCASARREGPARAPRLDAEHEYVRAPGRGLQAERAAAAVTRRVAVEAGVREPWWRYVGLKGQVVGIDTFGAVRAGQGFVQAVRLHGGARDKAIDAALAG